MTTKEETVEDRVERRVEAELTAIDMDARYDETLDECYSMESVGGPFAHMLASSVLETCDPVAYRCGFSDYTDSERQECPHNGMEFINEEFYDKEEVDEIRDEEEAINDAAEEAEEAAEEAAEQAKEDK